MVELHFTDQLKQDNIERILAENDFQNAYPVEQFIMDFEALVHIKEKLSDCVVRGGMAVPFHINDSTLHRLSVDIDIVTGHSKTEVISAMSEIKKTLGRKIDVPDPHIPRRQRDKQLPLLTYYCGYESNFNDEPQIKVEIFYSNKLNIKTKETTPTQIAGFVIDFPVSVYDREALIGDKLTTLPFNTIGLEQGEKATICKNIYDMCRLINTAPGRVSMREIIDSFEKIVNEEISYYVKDAPTFDQVLDDLIQFPENLLTTGRGILQLNAQCKGGISTFVTELLGKTRYGSHSHIEDIFLLKLLCMLIYKHYKDGLSTDKINQKFNSILSKKNKITRMEQRDQTRERLHIARKRRINPEHRQIISNMLPVHAYLYDQILQLE